MAWVTTEHPTRSELSACVQCGLCLPHCPTFRLTGKETASPRGRLSAMSAVQDGIVQVDQPFVEIIDFCLGCRACEPVCPGMVPYGRALEGTRAEIVAQRPSFSHRIRGFLLGPMLGSRMALGIGTVFLSLLQRLRLTRLVPGRFRRLTGGMRSLRGRPARVAGTSAGPVGGEVIGLLTGCVQDQWFRQTNEAAVALLTRAGYRVEAPSAQTCCGALAAHDGKAGQARRLAAKNVAAFGEVEHLVATAAGCSAHLAGYGHWADDGGAIAERSEDITVLIARAIEEGRLPRLPGGRGPIGVQDPCHLRHAQRVTAEPRAIVEAAGYEVVEIDPRGLCCGAAGLYTVLQPEASRELGNQKADQIRSTGVRKVATANPGCEMQMRSATDGDVQFAHPIEWYLDALAQSESAVTSSPVESSVD